MELSRVGDSTREWPWESHSDQIRSQTARTRETFEKERLAAFKVKATKAATQNGSLVTGNLHAFQLFIIIIIILSQHQAGFDENESDSQRRCRHLLLPQLTSHSFVSRLEARTKKRVSI